MVTTNDAKAAADREARNAGLRRLALRTDLPSRALATSIVAALTERVSAEEQTWFDRIEERRTQLAGSTAALVTPRSEWSGSPQDERVAREVLGEVCRTASKSRRWCALLFRLLRELRPDRALELGTCVGISAAYQGAALELNRKGELVTLEASRARLDMALEGFVCLGLTRVDGWHGRFQQTLMPTLEHLGVVDYALVDGHHDEQATLGYWGQIAPQLADPAIVVFDDIAWSRGMADAWDAITADARVKLAVDMEVIGFCVVGSIPEGGLLEVPFVGGQLDQLSKEMTRASESENLPGSTLSGQPLAS
jgi:predicted O-methyltransferase YrrM